MNSEAFQQAKDGLQPRDVYLRESFLRQKEKFESKYYPGELHVQHKHRLLSHEMADLTEKIGGQERRLKIFRVFMEFGCRIVEPVLTNMEDQESDEAKELVKAELIAIYVAEYEVIHEEVDAEGLNQFAARNARYHIWPFWREYLLNTYQRANLPRIVVPAIQV